MICVLEYWHPVYGFRTIQVDAQRWSRDSSGWFIFSNQANVVAVYSPENLIGVRYAPAPQNPATWNP